MSFYDRLIAETQAARDTFFSIPIVLEAAQNGVGRDLYIAYLTEAYHHVRHTCPLLAHALAHCPKHDTGYRKALLEYLEEEQGHEEWILDDIAHLGGDAEAVRRGSGDWPVRAMVSWVYYAVEFLNPYSMLGMVLVLEGTSVDIASAGADAVRAIRDRNEGFRAAAGEDKLSAAARGFLRESSAYAGACARNHNDFRITLHFVRSSFRRRARASRTFRPRAHRPCWPYR